MAGHSILIERYTPDEGLDLGTIKPGNWPALGSEPMDFTANFTSIDLCDWEPDWRVCKDMAAAGAWLHTGEVWGHDSRSEPVIEASLKRWPGSDMDGGAIGLGILL